MRGFSGKRILAVLVVALAIGHWAQMGVSSAQTAKTEKPVEHKAAPLKVEKRVGDGELKGEVSFELEDMIGWGIGLLTLLVTLLGIIVVILIAQGYFSKSKVETRKDTEPVPAKEYEVELRNSVEEVKEQTEKTKLLLEEARVYRDKTKALLEETAESFAKATEQERQIAENVLEDPQSSQMEKAVARAFSLQEQDKKNEAIEIWQSIVNIAQGNNNSRAAIGWTSIGYLLDEQGKYKEAIHAYTQSVDLNPSYVSAYNNRGLLKAARLRQYEAAIKDYNEAINRKEDYDIAYFNRGLAEAALGLNAEARKDFEKALNLARKAGDKDLATDVERVLQKLD